MKEIKKIVLTGGPCAGKTTALVKIVDYFSNYGYKVFTIPEVPTLYSQAGWNFLTPNRDLYYEGERAILETQLALEDMFMRMAEVCTKPTLIVCDRGTMDISAYMTPEMWEDITRKAGTDSNQLRGRYDAVLHLVSAADGAEKYYTTATNATRYEQMNEEGLRIARELDKKVVQAWTGHPHLRVINNNDDFNAKLNRVLKEIAHVLGLPQPIEEERKYLVEVVGEIPECSESIITQTYLVAEPGVATGRENSSTSLPRRRRFQRPNNWKRNDRWTITFTSRLSSRPIPTVKPSSSNARASSGRDSTSSWTPINSPSATLPFWRQRV